MHILNSKDLKYPFYTILDSFKFKVKAKVLKKKTNRLFKCDFFLNFESFFKFFTLSFPSNFFSHLENFPLGPDSNFLFLLTPNFNPTSLPQRLKIRLYAPGYQQKIPYTEDTESLDRWG